MNPGQPSHLAVAVACAVLAALGLVLVGFGEALGALREVAMNTRAAGSPGDSYAALRVISVGLAVIGGCLAVSGLAGVAVAAVSA